MSTKRKLDDRHGSPDAKKTSVDTTGTVPKHTHYAKRRVENDPSTFEVKGLCCAPHTPLTDDFKINPSVIPKMLERLINNRIHAGFINGTTGEGLSLTVSERKTLTEAWVDAAKGKDFTFISHVGCESLQDTIELAKHADSHHIQAVAITPPTFYKPTDIDGLVQWLKAISDAVPNMPIYYYHFSEKNGVCFPINTLLEKCLGTVKSLCGVKFTSYNLYELERSMLVDNHHYNLLIGREDTLLGALSMGCKGGIGATFSLLGNIFNQIIDNYESGNLEEARKLQEKANNATSIFHHASKYGVGVGFIEVTKAVLNMTGINIGPARIPRHIISNDGLIQLKKDLENIGFFNWCDK